MSNNTYWIIGALIVVVLIAVAVLRKPRKKKANPPTETIAEPPVQVPPVTADTGEWTLKLDNDPSALPTQPVISADVEIVNQTNFHIVVTRLGITTTVPPQGRTLMENDDGWTVSPSAQNTLQSVVMEKSSPESSAKYTLIVR